MPHEESPPVPKRILQLVKNNAQCIQTKPMKKVSLFLFVNLLLLSFSCNTTTKEPTIETPEVETTEIDELDRQIAQMLLVGFRGIELDSAPLIRRDIEKHQIGGIILYNYDNNRKDKPRNIVSSPQVKKLVSDLQAISEIPLFTAIDEEGGRVTRLKEQYGFEEAISAQRIGEIDQEDSTRYWAQLTAEKLAKHGINVNFAPVVDVNINPKSPAIGNIERSYSADPALVSKHASWVIDEHHKAGVLTSLKHFPGHGSAMADSHKGVTDVSQTWQTKELTPYRTLIKEGICDMIMTAHVFNNQLDEEYPATLSKKVMTDLLRYDLGYKGLIISDDMQMKAISTQYGLATALEKAINAGVDVMIFSNNIPDIYEPDVVPTVIKAIRKLVDEGKITKERIQTSYNRIMALKKKL